MTPVPGPLGRLRARRQPGATTGARWRTRIDERALRRVAHELALGRPRSRPPVGEELARWDIDGRHGERVTVTVERVPHLAAERVTWIAEPDTATGQAETVLHRRSTPTDVVVHVVAPGRDDVALAALAGRVADAVDPG